MSWTERRKKPSGKMEEEVSGWCATIKSSGWPGGCNDTGKLEAMRKKKIGNILDASRPGHGLAPAFR